MKIAVYPGSFDPMTLGHLDILKRALEMFDHVILLLAIHPKKQSSISVKDRKKILEKIAANFPHQRVSVETTDGLTIRFAEKKGAIALVRGLRAVPDFEYEHEIYAANQIINNQIEMVFFMAKKEYSFISSSIIKQLHEGGVDVSKLVPKEVLDYLNQQKMTKVSK